MSLTPQPQGVRPEIGPAYPARRTSGIGNWDQPKHTTCRGRLIWENPTYSAFWSVFGAAYLRLQWLASSVGFGTTEGLGPRKNLPCSGVTPEPQHRPDPAARNPGCGAYCVCVRA